MKDVYELLDTIAGHNYYTTLDLTSCYHQIPMDEDSKELTAFGMGGPTGGHYQFRVMPFGLKNAPATFQQVVDEIFKPYLGEFVVAYIDDVAIYSKTYEEHLTHTRKVFQLMREHGIYAKQVKCYFAQKEVPYLGHYVSEKGIRTNPAKVQAVRDYPEPKNLKQLRGFLGLAGYYRRFIKDFSKIAAPMNKLLKQGETFKWAPEQEEAKKLLAEVLTSAPVLKAPEYDKPFELSTDASNEGI